MKYIKKYAIYIVVVIVIIISIIVGLLTDETQPLTTTSIIEEQQTIDYIYIDLKGEVENPGVYKVTSSTRLYELIEKAGGLTSIADPDKVNLSSVLHDQEIIYIPSIFDEDINPIEIVDTLIDINQAPLELLTTLPGIGESTAQSIIDYRDEFGYFDQIEDIKNVSGIGDATFENIKDLIKT